MLLSARAESVTSSAYGHRYLLTGLVRCARCGKRYIGASATSKAGRYRYYVCFSRQRFGRHTCDADSLPAEELECAILAQLVSVLEQQPLVRQAITEAIEGPRPGEAPR